MLPQFPLFIRYSEINTADYLNFYLMFSPHADFSPLNLDIWLNFHGDLELSAINGNVIFRYSDVFNGGAHSVAIYGNHNPNETLEYFFEYAKSKQLIPRIDIAPDFFIEHVDSSNFLIHHDRNNDDYIFGVQKYCELEGGDYSQIRKRIRQFHRESLGEIASYDISVQDPNNAILLVNALHTWDRVYATTENDKQRFEGLAINKSLLLAAKYNQRCVGIFKDAKIVGFAMFQVFGEYAIVNHIKCDYEQRNFFEFMTHTLATYLQREGVKFMNFEQDLGIEGLRTHKNRMRPIAMHKKFKISSLIRSNPT